jgi:ubiquinone/menaquinone biosynthesis C-methylase UbiE
VDPKLQRRIQRYGWDKAAAAYDQSWQGQLEPAQAKLLAHAALSAGQSVIDVACGTGLVTLAAAGAVGPGGTVVGVDLSESMIDLARARAHARNLHHVRFARMDAEDLDLPAAAFDAALCALGLMYVPDAGKAVRQMARVLAPGGRAVAAVWGRRSRCGWAEVFPIVDARVRSEVCPLFFSLGTGDRLGEVFRAAGLVDVATERIETLLEWATADEACGAAFAGGPVALAYARFDERTRIAVHAEYLASIERWRADSGYAIPGEFVIAIGRSCEAGNAS